MLVLLVEQKTGVVAFLASEPNVCSVGNDAQQATEALIKDYPEHFPNPSDAMQTRWLLPKMHRALTVDRHGAEGYKTTVDGTKAWGAGKTHLEAIGVLVRDNPELFGVEIAYTPYAAEAISREMNRAR